MNSTIESPKNELIAMTLRICRINGNNPYLNYSWTVPDEDALAELVAYILIGQYRHAGRILDGVCVPQLTNQVRPAQAAIEDLKRKNPSHRDGLLFQMISWIAARQVSSEALIFVPSIQENDGGVDGLQLHLNQNKTAIDMVIVFEDKATENPRDTIRKDVWKWIDGLEKNGTGLHKISIKANAMLYQIERQYHNFVMDTAISDTLWGNLGYRISITINDQTRCTNLFDGFDEMAPGEIDRRQANTIYFRDLRQWMKCFADRVIRQIRRSPNV